MLSRWSEKYTHVCMTSSNDTNAGHYMYIPVCIPRAGRYPCISWSLGHHAIVTSESISGFGKWLQGRGKWRLWPVLVINRFYVVYMLLSGLGVKPLDRAIDMGCKPCSCRWYAERQGERELETETDTGKAVRSLAVYPRTLNSSWWRNR